MAGRPAEASKQKYIDAILSIWPDQNTELTFTQIHRRLIEKGIVEKEKYHYKTNRILKKLGDPDIGLVEKVSRGRYRIKVEPKEFQVFDYLQTLRKECGEDKLNFSSRVGGFFWSLAELFLLGMPEEAMEHPDVDYALDILVVRLANIFQALKDLSTAVVARRDENTSLLQKSLPPNVIRELLLELLPYYLGSRAGIDHDGLPTEDLNNVLKEMIKAMPSRTGQGDWMSSTSKKQITKSLGFLCEMHSKLKEAGEEMDYEKLKPYYKNLSGPQTGFAIIITEPEEKIHVDSFEKRRIYQDIKKYGKGGNSPLFIASSLLPYKKENVKDILEKYGSTYLGEGQWEETKDLYEKIYASHQAGRIISFGRLDEFLGQDLEKSLEYFRKLVETYSSKIIIFYLPFSLCRLNFILPTPEKEKILKKFFPSISSELIHKWLNDGVKLAVKINEKKFEEFKKMLEDKKFRVSDHDSGKGLISRTQGSLT